VIAGRFFDGQSSDGIEATLQFGADGIARVYGVRDAIGVPAAELKFSERLGNIPRRIGFPGGGVFETHDNDAVDQALEALGLEKTSALVHWLEHRWPVAIGALVCVALLSVGFLRWGVPAIANRAAEVMPANVDRLIGSGSLDILDRTFFEPSELPASRVRELRARFAEMTRPLKDGHEYHLEFRRGRAIGANAFALPSGIIVMTDELVELSKNDDELVAVLAHEVGHVRGRHALRQMLQAAGVSALAVALLGDVSSISGILSAAPALLHAKHSRDFEREADAFGKTWLKEHNIPESSFDAILCRMTKEHGVSPDADATDYFSSHPPTSERVRCVKEAPEDSGKIEVE
jgi:Zn-dependent protease with chaperone function